MTRPTAIVIALVLTSCAAEMVAPDLEIRDAGRADGAGAPDDEPDGAAHDDAATTDGAAPASCEFAFRGYCNADGDLVIADQRADSACWVAPVSSGCDCPTQVVLCESRSGLWYCDGAGQQRNGYYRCRTAEETGLHAACDDLADPPPRTATCDSGCEESDSQRRCDHVP